MPSITEVADEIKRYSAAHPGVRDTLEGIAWWLAMQRCSETREVLTAAVDLLVEQKFLTSYRLADGTTVFGRGLTTEMDEPGRAEPQEESRS